MTCRTEEGGSPGCNRGFSCSRVQMSGKSLKSIEASIETGRSVCYDDYDKEYDLLVVIGYPNEREEQIGSIGFNSNFSKIAEYISSAGFTSNKVFITYLTKCGGNKKPTVKEIKSCAQYLRKEIKSLKPKVIMTLGTLGLKVFNLNSKGEINKIRGELFKVPLPLESEEELYSVIPSIDPGALHYSTDPSLEKRIRADYVKAYRVTRGIIIQPKQYACKYKLATSVSDIKDLASECKSAGFFAFDTESRGLPWEKQPLICISFSLGIDKNWIVPIYQHDSNGLDWKLKKYLYKSGDGSVCSSEILHLLKEIFSDPSIEKAAHNFKYDKNVLRKHLGIIVKGFSWDSMLMHHLLMEQGPQGLEYLADLEFGVGDYSAPLHAIVGKGKVLLKTYDYIEDDMLWQYAANDAECCWKLTNLYKKELLEDKGGLFKLYKEEVEPLTHTLADAEWHGYKIDISKLPILESSYIKERDETLNYIRDRTFPTFNPSSPKNVLDALSELGFLADLVDEKNSSGYSTNAEKLSRLKEKYPNSPKIDIVDKILNYRNVIKIIGTYIENLKNDVDRDHRVRYSWKIHGTKTGRLSQTLVQQVPRPDIKRVVNLRDVFIAPPGKKLLYLDYSQIELKVIAIESNDKEMLRLFEEGEDIHRATAAALLDIKEEKISDFNRQCGKTVNFGLAYGSKGTQLIATGKWEDSDGNRYPITWDMFNRGMERFQFRFPNVIKYLEDVPAICRSSEDMSYRTVFGRKRRMGIKLNDNRKGVREAAEREIVNFSIQSPASSVSVRTLNLVQSWIDEWREQGLPEEDIFLVSTVHDSGIWEVADGRIDGFKSALKIATERTIPELDNHSFPCKIGVGESWKEAEENAG